MAIENGHGGFPGARFLGSDDISLHKQLLDLHVTERLGFRRTYRRLGAASCGRGVLV